MKKRFWEGFDQSVAEENPVETPKPREEGGEKIVQIGWGGEATVKIIKGGGRWSR